MSFDLNNILLGFLVRINFDDFPSIINNDY